MFHELVKKTLLKARNNLHTLFLAVYKQHTGFQASHTHLHLHLSVIPAASFELTSMQLRFEFSHVVNQHLQQPSPSYEQVPVPEGSLQLTRLRHLADSFQGNDCTASYCDQPAHTYCLDH